MSLPNLIGRTERDGRSYWRFDDGTMLPVVSGGDGPTADPPAPVVPPAPETPAGRTFSQDEVTRMLAAEKAQGERAAERALLAQFGVEKPEDVKTILEAHRAAEDARRTETQRAEAAAVEAKRLADADRAAAASDRKAAAIERALAGSGLQLPEKADEAAAALASAVRLVDLDGEPTPEAVKTAVDKVKATFPSLFAPAGRTIPNSDPTGRQQRQGGAPTGVAAGRERARQEREEAQKRGNPLDRLSFVGGRRP